ncbi:hypothetical protein [Saccharothrix syringae]|uniref:Uncharacterized protein n=1 Tax=Saccharothrix syringae TaxID=103733 RepID=A0A5Q0GU98_SACSY|nr:hypothetical protein [Saccharothrix syringae]QFZ17568.1 hypothetical protein EKG83_08805 [Saccharothrix syringae]
MGRLIVPGQGQAEIVKAYPVLRGLLDLRAGGWKFLPVEPGREEIDGYRQWPGPWRDAIRFRDEDDALGLRLRLDDGVHLVWERTGGLAEIVNELLLLPAPGHRLAPRLARGHGPDLR